ncbi:MAG: hypothetical protein MJ206_02280 [Bacilli bacterium]|nr:hypothetical protein [Bacilli bacterium]
MYLKRITLLLFATISLVGCNNGDKGDKILVTDMVGDEVLVPKNPKKVACVSRTTYDLLVAYGLGDKIDGAYKGTLSNKWVPFIYPESSKHYVYEYDNSPEVFLSRGVDLVFAPEQYIAKNLRDHGVNAVCISLYGNPSFDNYVTFFSEFVTKVWDSEEIKIKAKKWENKVTDAINDIKQRLKDVNNNQKVVFYVRGDKNNGVCYTDTIGAFTEYAYRTLGFDFVGSHVDTNRPSKETVLSYNPDIFVFGGIYQNINQDLFNQDAEFSKLGAETYSIPIGLTAFEQLSAMTPVFFYDQAKKIYPSYFTDININQMIKETIAEYFMTVISDEQVGFMMSGLGPNGEPLV